MNITIKLIIIVIAIIFFGVSLILLPKLKEKKWNSTCRECGTKITDKNAKQCPKCGNPIR